MMKDMYCVWCIVCVVYWVWCVEYRLCGACCAHMLCGFNTWVVCILAIAEWVTAETYCQDHRKQIQLLNTTQHKHKHKHNMHNIVRQCSSHTHWLEIQNTHHTECVLTYIILKRNAKSVHNGIKLRRLNDHGRSLRSPRNRLEVVIQCFRSDILRKLIIIVLVCARAVCGCFQCLMGHSIRIFSGARTKRCQNPKRRPHLSTKIRITVEKQTWGITSERVLMPHNTGDSAESNHFKKIVLLMWNQTTWEVTY